MIKPSVWKEARFSLKRIYDCIFYGVPSAIEQLRISQSFLSNFQFKKTHQRYTIYLSIRWSDSSSGWAVERELEVFYPRRGPERETPHGSSSRRDRETHVESSRRATESRSRQGQRERRRINRQRRRDHRDANWFISADSSDRWEMNKGKRSPRGEERKRSGVVDERERERHGVGRGKEM